MITTLFGFKIDQTRQFTEDGARIPVTRILVEPHVVTSISETPTTHTYQLGIGQMKRTNKPLSGHLKKAGIEKKPRFLREVAATSEGEMLKVGSEIKASDVFTAGDAVFVIGTSKGKGFAGGVKRHHFSGGPKTHGQDDRWRGPGSIGAGTTPGRVLKGQRMAGRMGNDTVTVKGLKIVAVDAEKNIVTVKGLIPGAKRGLVMIAKQG